MKGHTFNAGVLSIKLRGVMPHIHMLSSLIHQYHQHHLHWHMGLLLHLPSSLSYNQSSISQATHTQLQYLSGFMYKPLVEDVDSANSVLHYRQSRVLAVA